MSSIHVAIVDQAAAKHLLVGTKSSETRFYRRRRPPFGSIRPGDTVYFKLSGGNFIGTTSVLRVRELDDLTPAGVAHLRSRYNHAIQAPAPYWRTRRRCRYGLLIWINRSLQPRLEYGSHVNMATVGWSCLEISRLQVADAAAP